MFYPTQDIAHPSPSGLLYFAVKLMPAPTVNALALTSLLLRSSIQPLINNDYSTESSEDNDVAKRRTAKNALISSDWSDQCACNFLVVG